MAIDAEDLVIQPFRELIERANEAATNAQDGADESPDAAKLMAKAAASLAKEGERALSRLQPLWIQQSDRHGETFTNAIRDNATIAEGRRVLEDLLYDFDDYTELDTFESERYTQLQAASKSFARSAIETIKTMKIEMPAITESQPAAASPATVTPGTPSSPDPTQLVFPPLPPLPPLSPRSAASRPQTAYEATQGTFRGHGHHATTPIPPALRTSVKSSRNDGLARNDSRMSHSSQGSARRASSKVGSATANYHHGSIQLEVAHATHRVSPNLEVLGEEIQKIRLVQRNQSPPPPLAPDSSPWAVPRTTAWVTEQAVSPEDSSRVHRGSIPEDVGSGFVTAGNVRRPFVNRYTSDSSRPPSSVFDGPGSPETTAYRSSHNSHSNGEEFICLDNNNNNSQNQQQHRSSSNTLRTNSLNFDGQREHLDIPQPSSRMDALAEHDEPLPIQHPVPHSFDTGLMLAREDDSRSVSRAVSPIWYSRKANCSIGADSSLYLKGGCCRGATAFRTDGLESGTKIVYDYLDKKSESQCISCEYRQDTARIQNDIRRAANANFITEGIIYRQRFLYKSHMSTNISTSTPFSCVFCTQDGRTTREGDATVFRTKDQLFKHLARHPQPLVPVTGIKVFYGEIPKDDPDATNFDLHFPDPSIVAMASLTDDQAEKLAQLPTGTARKDHNEGYGPDNLDTSILRFYAGARIVGVEYPEEYDGKWCRGWHDGAQGLFPSKLIELEPPTRREVKLAGMSGDGITVKARWKFAPKESAAGWLAFDKGDIVQNVSWTTQEQWCWSGMTKNGKVGFFPQSHIKPGSVSTTVPVGPSIGTGGAKSIKSGSKMKMFGLKRTTTVSSNHS